MKTVYPLVALLSVAIVAAGPLPRNEVLETRDNIMSKAGLMARTEQPAAPAAPMPAAPAPAPVASTVNPAPVAPAVNPEAQRLADEKAGML